MFPIITWPAPAGEPASPDYTIMVEETPVFVYQARVRAEILQNDGLWTHKTDPAGERASFAIFDMAAPVTVTVRPTRHFTRATILPIGTGIVPEIKDGAVRFTLAHARHLTLVLDDSDTQPLHLFISTPEVDAPKPGDPNVVYFGPGVHNLATLRVHSGQTVYLAGGAIVRAVLAPDEQGKYNEQWKVKFYTGPVLDLTKVHNVCIRGRGILDGARVPHPGHNFIHLRQARQVRLEGIVLRDAPNWNVTIMESQDITVEDLRIVSGRLNSDGINSVNSRNVHIRRCFVRNHDDSIVVKTTAPGHAAEDISVEQCVIWNDWGYALGATYETRSPISRVHFRDCAILFARHWCMGVHVSDSATVSDLSFSHVEVDLLSQASHSAGADAALTTEPKLLRLHIGEDCWGHDHTRGHIRGITLEDIDVFGPAVPALEMFGFDKDHTIRDLTLRRLRLNGHPALNADLRITRNAFVDEVKIE